MTEVKEVLRLVAGSHREEAHCRTAGARCDIVSMILAFLSGMDIMRRVVTNLVIIAAAVGVTFTISLVTKLVWGVSL